MKRSFLLGVLGGIFSFSMGILAFLAMAIDQANGAVVTDLTINIVLAFLAGTLGIIGSAIGNKRGGVVLIASAVLALIATSFFGIPSFVLLLVGGMLSFKESGTPEIEYPVAHGVSKGKKRGILFYITVISCLVGIIALIFSGLSLWHTYFLLPRAKLTISIGSFEVSSSDNTWASMSIHIGIANNSPRTANILKDWNFTLIFSNSTFQFPIQNCTYGTTKLDPAQQTEFVFSYDITNNTSIDTNALRSMIFTISYIDDQGTQTQQFEAIRPHS